MKHIQHNNQLLEGIKKPGWYALLNILSPDL